MELFDRMFGSNSGNDEDGENNTEDIPITQYYFVGNDIESNPLDESMVVLRQGPPEEGDVSENKWVWSVVKCNRPLEARSDMDVHLCVHKEGSIVDIGEPYQSNLAWLLSEEDIDNLSNQDSIIRSFPFPEELRDQTIPEGTRWGEEDLQSLLLPLKS